MATMAMVNAARIPPLPVTIAAIPGPSFAVPSTVGTPVSTVHLRAKREGRPCNIPPPR